MATLVTGAAGFIGSHVVDRLLSDGRTVVGLDSFEPFYGREIKEANLERAVESKAFSLVEGDIRDSDVLGALPQGIDGIVHLAALAGVRPSILRPREYMSVNVDGTASLLEFARARGISNFVLSSSSSVYGDHSPAPFVERDAADRPISPYAASKRAAEVLAHSYSHLFDVGVHCLRFFTVYGPRQRPDLAIHKFARLMAAGLPIPVYGDGAAERDYSHVADIVDGVAASLRTLEGGRREYEVINLGGSETISLSRMIDTLAEQMGVVPVIDRQPMQPGDVRRTFADLTRATALLGFEPRIGFEEGIRTFVEWFREQ